MIQLSRIAIMASLLSLMTWACTTQAVPPSPLLAPPPPQGATLDDMVKAARADAAQRTGLAPEALALISAEAVTWSDGSLGCPQPGKFYTQALVPGYRVRLRGPDGEMDYHASTRGAPMLCPAGRSAAPLPGASRM
jgi:hypothetical protein